MSKRDLTLLKILLIAIMVFQPAVSAYAMTAMHHSPSRVISQAMPDHEMVHGVMHQAMNKDASSVSTDGCCTSTCSMMSCSVALLQNPLPVTVVEITSVVLAYQIS